METQVVHFSQAAFVKPFVFYLENMGIDTAQFLDRAGISQELLEAESTPVPVRLIFDFINSVSAEYQISDLCLLVGKNCSAQTFSELGAVLLTARHVREYLEAGCQVISSFSSGDHYWMDYSVSPSRFCISLFGREESDKAQNALFIILITINTIRDAIGKPWYPDSITVPRMGDETAAHLAETFPHSRIDRHGAYASFSVPDSILDHDMRDMTSSRSEYSIASYPIAEPTDFLSSLRKLVGTLIISGKTDMETAALASGLTRRRLQRRLAECGTSYSNVLLESRIALAKQWIGEGCLPLNEVSKRLGYSDPANFTRAFRRNTGVSPIAYQRAVGQK